MWKTTKAQLLENISPISVITVDLKRDDYKGNVGYVCAFAEPNPDEDVAEYIESASSDPQKMYDYGVKTVSSLLTRDENAKNVVLHLLEKYKEKLLYWPGAYKIHHAYRGGLMEHTARVMFDVSCVCKCLHNGINSKIEDAEASVRIDEILATGGVLCQKTRDIYRDKIVFLGNSGVFKKLEALCLANELLKGYKWLSRDILFSSIALRGMSSLGMEWQMMGEVVGLQTADAMFLREQCTAEELASEPFRLLEHCLCVSKEEDGNLSGVIPEAFLADYITLVAEVICEAKATGFDEAIAIEAAVVHDIGKLKELNSDELGVSEYSIDGNLFKHINIGVFEIQDACHELGIPVSSSDDIRRLLHCVASHHEKMEWDALIVPRSKEAKVVAMMDYIDSKLAIYEYHARNLEKGERDESTRQLLNASVYKPEM